MENSLVEKLRLAQENNKSHLALLINPIIHKMPGIIQKYDEPFLPFGKAVINTTHDLVCAYIFDLATYLSIGAAGAIALERTVAYVPNNIMTILHGPFSTTDYNVLIDDISFGVDAITINQHDNSFHSQNDHNIVFHHGNFIVPNGMKLSVIGESVLYAAKGADFSEHIRNKLEQIYNE